MHFFLIGVLIMQAARLACGTCVFESDFGFILNCNFKKSGLFRVRNLGGLKAHFGLGFSLGDELGFGESLGNLEGERRRAISYKNGSPSLVGVLPAAQQVPAQYSIPEKHITSRSTGPLPVSRTSANRKGGIHRRPPASVPLMTEARPLPLGVPAFRPIPKTAAASSTAQRRSSIGVDSTNPRISVNNKLVEQYNMKPVHSNRTYHVANPILSQPVGVPAFQAMPNSVARITDTMHSNQIETPNYLQFEEPKFDMKDVTIEELAAAANVSVATIKHAIYVREQQMKAEHRAMLAAKLRDEFMRTSTTPRLTTMRMSPTMHPTTKTTRIEKRTTTSTQRPVDYFESLQLAPALPQIDQNIAHENKMSKVMNAPKEYYPAGYDKNFDDNFKSKVDLPRTSFSCGKQKHFPGLYADTDLGCMVFHVCALTDDGLVRKSFLCPENTLFDQTILKCNWWFYVDCNASKSVYDSNIPISKSYQLMKSLTYFSKYAKSRDDDSPGLNIQTLSDSMDDDKAERNAKQESTGVTSPSPTVIVTPTTTES